MYAFIKGMTLRRFLFEQAPALSVSLLIAELFYKFHSFLLECVAFLATWYAIDGMFHFLISLWTSTKTKN